MMFYRLLDNNKGKYWMEILKSEIILSFQNSFKIGENFFMYSHLGGIDKCYDFKLIIK